MNPSRFDKWLLKARQLMQLNEFPEALNLYGKLFKAFPQCGFEYGRMAAQSGNFDLALQVWEQVRRQAPANIENLCRLAGEFSKLGLHAHCRDLLLKAVRSEPGNLSLNCKVAWLLARTHGVAEARVAVEKCLAINLQSEHARFLSALLDRRENKWAEAETQFRYLLIHTPETHDIHYSCHTELANICDRTGRPDEAMALLATGKKIVRQHFKFLDQSKQFQARDNFEAAKINALPANILSIWREYIPEKVRPISVRLAFLTGSARSGTTLIEKILDAHPEIVACDEVAAFKKINPQVELTVAGLSAQRLEVLRQLYLKNLSHALPVPCASKILLDKNPSHTSWLPALLRLFPELRVLIALRDPRDVMMSLYFQDLPNTNYLTFEELAQHYATVMNIWLAIRKWEGLAWMEIRYEDVVNDLSAEGMRTTRFLGASWVESQTRYHELNREKPILSTNYNDVTQPVYSRAMNRWRAYEKYLGSALPILEPYLKEFGY